jgi:hypothetical protein
MGHLINPIAFRLNFFKSWEDSWFVKNIYYPEFFNGMLKLRNYLYYFLTEKRILKSGIFLSNFFIIKYNKIYIINIYIYHIDFEKLSFECINNLYSSFFSYNRNNKIRKISNFFKLFINNIDVFFFIIFFYKIFYKKKIIKKKNIYKFFQTNLFLKSNDFQDYYKNLLLKCNEIIINKLFNVDFFKKKELELKELKLNEKYEYNILINYNNLLLKNKNFKEYEYKSYKLSKNKIDDPYSNLTLFEFVMFLLKKVGFNSKNKIFDKILKFKCMILFLSIFKNLDYKFTKIKLNYSFLLFFFISLLKSILINLKNIKIKANKNNIRNKVYFLLYNYLGYKFFFKEFKIIISFLNNIFFILNKVRNISYRFFFLSNRNITARWLCRYIGIKLKNNYSFYSVLNPIKKELYKLCKLNKKRNYNKLYNLNNLIKRNNFKLKLKFKNLIHKFFFLYIKENFLYYINNNNYIYDLYIYFNNKKEIRYFNLFNFLKTYKYIYINIFISFYWELNLLKKQKILDNIIYKIYNFLLININNKFNIELKKFYFSIFFFNNLLKFNYFKYIWLQIKKFNARNIRNSNIIKYSMLLGYKLAFKGRFSRKQRASNIWYMHGKVPLNTLSVKLDYFFFTIPLKNSAISIKIILYKSLYNEKFKYLLIY